MKNLCAFLLALGLLPTLAAAQTSVPADRTTNAYANETLIEATNSIELQAGFSATPTAGFTAQLVPNPAVHGQWSANRLWTPEPATTDTPLGGIMAVHTHVLPDGRVLSWSGHNDDAHYYTNGTQALSHTYAWSASPTSAGYPAMFTHHDNYDANLFCSGHSLLANGALLVAGGHLMDGQKLITGGPNRTPLPRTSDMIGIPPVIGYAPPAYTGPYIGPGPIGLNDTYQFAYQNAAPGRLPWSARNVLPIMSQRRWYPTVTSLANGDALAIAGQQWTTLGPVWNVALVPEVWQASTSSWRQLTGASRPVPEYPWMHLALDGTVFNAGPNASAAFLNTAGAGSWTNCPQPTTRNRAGGSEDWTYGNSVMYVPGKIINLGGGLYSSTNKATELIDITAGATGTTVFRRGADMLFPRKHANSTILADGSVLVVGGSTSTTSGSDEFGVLYPELWNPPGKLTPLGVWQVMAPMSVARMYHSTGVLLPDGTVFAGGGGQNAGHTNHPDYQIFTPPYLLRLNTTRPVINYAPLSVQYGQQFTVQSASATTISRATLVRLSSVTHSFNMNQRFMNLVIAFEQTQANSLSITAPSNANIAPPGHYMLFLINGDGVPSVSSIIHVSASACATPPVGLSSADVAGTQSDCSVQVRVTATSNVAQGQGTDYRWTLDGVRMPNFDNQPYFDVTCTPNRTNAVVRCETTPTNCNGAATGVQTTVTRFFPNCISSAP